MRHKGLKRWASMGDGERGEQELGGSSSMRRWSGNTIDGLKGWLSGGWNRLLLSGR